MVGIPFLPFSGPSGKGLGSGLCCCEGGLLDGPLGVAPLGQRALLGRGGFRKRTELACELIRSFEPPLGSQVIVLVDSTYCCKPPDRNLPGPGLYPQVKKDRLLFDGRRAFDVSAGTVAHL